METMFKRFLSFTLAVLMVVSYIPTSAFATGNDPECEHSYVSVETKTATCTEAGVITKTCTVCADSYTEESPLADHSYASEVTQEATCTVVGVITYTCTDCGKSYTEEIGKADHQYSSTVTKEATCEKKGEATYTCSVCKDTYTEEIDFADHKYASEVTTKPTCEKKGEATYTCSVCKDTYTEEIGLADHQYASEVTKEATCEEKGEATYTCSVCEHTYTEEIDFADHKYASEVTTEPTCKDKGVRTFTCEVCEDSYTEEIETTNKHSYSEGKCTVCGKDAPTCVCEAPCEAEANAECPACAEDIRFCYPVAPAADDYAIYLDADQNGEVDESDVGYASFDDMLAELNGKDGEFHVILKSDVATTTAFTITNNTGFVFKSDSDEERLIHIDSQTPPPPTLRNVVIGENVTLSATGSLNVSAKLNVQGKVRVANTLVFNAGAEVIIGEDADVQAANINVVSNAVVTINGTVDATDLTLRGDNYTTESDRVKLVISGSKAQVAVGALQAVPVEFNGKVVPAKADIAVREQAALTVTDENRGIVLSGDSTLEVSAIVNASSVTLGQNIGDTPSLVIRGGGNANFTYGISLVHPGAFVEGPGGLDVMSADPLYEVSFDTLTSRYTLVEIAGSEPVMVAEANGQQFDSLQDAINAGGTVTLLTEVVLEEPIVVEKGNTVVLDMGGYSISQEKECTGSYSMIDNKGNLTVTGIGTISFTDTGTGDPSFGWGSYTIRNEGNLVFDEYGQVTVEHLGQQNAGGSAVHMYCAIFQYSGSTTIMEGVFSTPTYRSVRLWKGDMNILGGQFNGQVWVQAVDNSAKLTIGGNTARFAPSENIDASSVFIENSTYDVDLTVTGGFFNTKLGCSNAQKLAGSVTGGIFTQKALDGMGTNASILIKTGYELVSDGGPSFVQPIQPTETPSFNVTVPDEVTVEGEVDETVVEAAKGDIAANEAVKTSEGLQSEANKAAAQEASIALIDELVEAGEISSDAQITSEPVMSIELTGFTGEETAITELSFNVEPQIKVTVVDGEQSESFTKKIETKEDVTFNLPLPSGFAEYVDIFHGDVKIAASVAVMVEDGQYYVPVTSASFSPFTVAKGEAPKPTVAMIGDVPFTDLQEALDTAEPGQTISIVSELADVDVTVSKNVTIDLGNKTLTDAYIKIAADVTIQNGSIKNVNESYPLVVNKGTLTVEDVAIEASASDRAIWLNGAVTLNFNSGSSILATKGGNNSKSKIYGIWVSQGATANINGGTIEVDAGPNATAVAIFGNYANTVNVNGGKISTSGKNYSYAIWVDGNVTVKGGEIVTNEKQYGYSSGITYGYNYAINSKGNVAISGDTTITTYGHSGYLVNAGGSNQEVTVSDVAFTNVLAEADKTDGGHSEPALIKGSSVTAEITGGNFNGVSATLIKGTGSTLEISGGTFDVDVSNYAADGFEVKENPDGSFGVAEKPPIAKIGGKGYQSLQAAIDEAVDGDIITLVDTIVEDVVVTQIAGRMITINGNGNTMSGVIVVDGKSGTIHSAGLTIKDIDFVADSINQGAFINLGDGSTATRYVCNVTVEDCTFTYNGTGDAVAIKSYTGGDYGLTVTGCTVNEGMHSFIQVTNVTGLVVDNCDVYSKGGINLNSSSAVEVKNSTFDVDDYALRAGAGSGGSSGEITLTDNILKTSSTEDAVIILRGAAVSQIDLEMSKNVVSGETHISGTTEATKVSADANYWDGEVAPVVSGTAVAVDSYYTDEALSNLVVKPKGTITYCFTTSNSFWGEMTGNPKESVVIKLYEGDKEIASAVMAEKNLNNQGNGNTYVTWSIPFNGKSSDDWAVQWVEGYPKRDMAPTKVAAVVDGTEVATNDVQLNAPDNLNKIVAVVSDADGNFLGYSVNLNDILVEGCVIEMINDAKLSDDVTLPAGATLVGNGKQINGTIVAGGNLTIQGHVKVTSFSASYYNRVITIGEGACLEVTGTGRVTLGYGNTFNITGVIENAKTADKTKVQPSLIVPGGLYITGNGATWNVTNAYVKIGLSTSKSTTETFDIDFNNSIVDVTNNFSFGNNNSGVIDLDVKDSVLNLSANLDLMDAKCDMLIDNSVVTVGSSMRNDGTLKLINGSELTVKTQIQPGEHGGNTGTITVDASKLTVECSTIGHAFDSNETGKLEVVNGGSADIDYIVETLITVDTESSITANQIKDGAITVDAEKLNVLTSNSVLNLTTALTQEQVAAITVINSDGASVTFNEGKLVVNKAPVAMVGNTEYASIDEAIANWTNNSTLTLLRDVTLSDVITLKSTEHHILNLGTSTMTAASGKNAIEILACGTGDAERSAITINADATNPGGINAGSKSVIYYNFANGGITGNDRPIIKINGGVFTGANSSGTAGIYFKGGSAARQAATVNISGGTFNCSINGQSKSKLIITGGTFNYSVGSQGDSTANRLISGGTFKTFGFMTADTNNTKFWFGTSMGNSNVGVYVDDNGYIVVGGSVISEAGDKFEASSANYGGASSLLAYSSAKTEGLYYTDAHEAFADNNKATGEVTIYQDVDMTESITYKGTIYIPEGEAITISYPEGTTRNWTVKAPDGKQIVEGEEIVVDGVVKIVYSSFTPVAKVGDDVYKTLAEAIADANGKPVEVMCNVEESLDAIENVTLTTNVEGGVTITNTSSVSYVNFNNVTLGSGVTLNNPNTFASGSDTENIIEGTLNVNGYYYNAYDATTIVRDGGKVTTTGMTINRYNTDPEAGIYIDGDGDAATVEWSCANTIGTYSGTFYVENAVVNGNKVWLDHEEEGSDYPVSDAEFVNSVLNVTADIRLYNDASLTLTGSAVNAGMVQVRENATPVVNADSNSVVKADSVLTQAGAILKANRADDGTVTFERILLGSGNSAEDPYQINNLSDLLFFAEQVNAGNTYAGKFVKLNASIDLEGTDWTPIGYMGKTFKGSFNGGGNTIFNLTCVKDLTNTAVNNGIGLFGRTDDNAVIENLTIENVTLQGSLYVGAVVGLGYTGSKIENVTVKGDIAIDAYWYAGTIGGNGYMTLVNDCHVIGNDGSYIKGNNGSYIGGIWGFRGEGANDITNCSVTNLSITGVDRVGGISGMGHYGNTISDCSVEDVNIQATDPEATTVGLIVGATQGTDSSPTTITKATVTDTTAKAGDKEVTGLYGTNINGGVPVTNWVAEINGKQYESIQDAVDAAGNGDTIILRHNVTQKDGVLITDKKLTLDLNEKTFTVSEGANVNNRNIKVDGASVVTIKNGTMVAAGDYSSGSYGTLRTEGTAKVTLEDLKLYNYRGNGLNVKVYTGSTVTMTDVEVYSEYGGGIEAAGGTIDLYNVTVDQKGMYTQPYNSTAISVNMGGQVTVHSGTYSTEPKAASDGNNQGTSHGSFVAGICNSGGTLIINGGTFSNGNYGDDSLATNARGLLAADTGGFIEINGGFFKALKNIIQFENNLGDASKNPTAEIYGGIFSADPTVPAGSGADRITIGNSLSVVENTDGTYTVKAQYEARINNKYFATLAEAIEKARANENIILLSNVYADVLEITKNVKISGYDTLTCNAIHITGSNALTLNGITVNTKVYADNVEAGATVNGKDVTGTEKHMSTLVYDGSNITLTNPLWVAEVDHEYFVEEEFGKALEAIKAGGTLNLLADVTVTEDWDCRDYKNTAPIIIEGNEKIIKFTGKIFDGYNHLAAFRFESDATINDLTIDMSEAKSGWGTRIRAISTESNLTVDNCKFIGTGEENNTRAIIFGESTKTLTDIAVSITNSVFENWRFGVSDGENAKVERGVKTASVIGNTFTNASAQLSASDSIIFTGNILSGDDYVTITSYAADTNLEVEATGNTIPKDSKSKVSNLVSYDNIQDEFIIVVPVTLISGNVEAPYNTLAAALAAAEEGDTVRLNWAEGDKPIVMTGSVCGKTVTITGTATVDWSKGWLFAGRGGNGDGTIIFRDANLTAASNQATYGIHVSGREKNTTDKYNGTVELINSNIDLDYLINKGTMTLDNSTLTVKNGFSNGGRPANQTESGVDATATMTLNSNSKLVVGNHNGMGLGFEAIGILNVNDSSFETTQKFLITEKGTLNVNNGTVKIADTLTNNGTINVSGTSDIAANVTGEGWVYMKGVNLDADTNLVGAKVRFASGTNNVDGSIIDEGFFQVGIGAYEGVDANVDTENGVIVNVKNANIGSNGKTYAGWVGTGFYDTDAEKAAAMTDAKYVLNIENSIAEFGYLHVSNDGELNVNGNAAEKAHYNNSDYSFYAGEIIVNGTANFEDTDVLALFTKVSCDNGTDAPGTLNVNAGTEYEAERHNGAASGTSFLLYKTGVVNVNDAELYIGDETSIAAAAKLNIAGKVTAVGSVSNKGTITLTDAKASFTAPENLTVESAVEGYLVKYENGVYTIAQAVAKIGDEYFATLQAAIDEAEEGAEIVLQTNVELAAPITVSAGKVITLNLGEYTVSYETTECKRDSLLTNYGDLTILGGDAGKLSYAFAGQPDTSYSTGNQTIDNWGTLTVKSGTVENTTAAMAHAFFAIDTREGATLNVEGGKVLSLNGQAIRMASFNTAEANVVNISGGYVEGVRAIQIHMPSDATSKIIPEMALNISGGELKSNEDYYNLAIYVISNGQSAEKVTLNISKGTINGNVALNAAATNTMAANAASVTGGTINGEWGIYSYAADAVAAPVISITGGTFATNYSEMYAEDDGFKFVKNEDGTYGVVGATTGTITDTGRTLSLDDIIYINQYAMIEGFEDIDIAKNGGMLIWNTAVNEEEAVFGTEDVLKEGLIKDGAEYKQHTDGFVPKMFADSVFLRIYVKDNDGNYTYGPLKEFSVRLYCETVVGRESSKKELKDLCVAILDFGAAAQVEFTYNMSDPANKNIQDYPRTPWNDGWLEVPASANTNIVATGTISDNGRTLSLDSEVKSNHYYGFDGEYVSGEVLFWEGVSGELTVKNATYSKELRIIGNEYSAQSNGFVPKEYGKIIYTCAHIVDNNGQDHYSDVIAFSPEEYARRIIEKSSDANLIKTVKAMVTYGELAKIYFNK